tara:strand:+ start:1632 stop:1991 length:360 start_codon:yes stop_codon:yes gene_type:complete
MNLFVERNKAAFDVTLTLSVDNITLKENLEFENIWLCKNTVHFEASCKTGMPVFSVIIDDVEWQGCCTTIRNSSDGSYLLQLFDDSSFGEAIVEQKISEDDLGVIHEYVAVIIRRLMVM